MALLERPFRFLSFIHRLEQDIGPVRIVSWQVDPVRHVGTHGAEASIRGSVRAAGGLMSSVGVLMAASDDMLE